jgi:hypothetical protein
VHCLGTFEVLTWDHVFPSGWYPEGTPDDLEKWKMPACRKCNLEHSKGEGDLLVKLGMCIDPDEPKSAGIAEKALRATRASEGRDEQDAKRREALRQKLLRQVLEGDDIPRHAIFPGFGSLPGQSKQEQVAIPVSATAIRRLAEKVVRGLIYVVDGKIVDDPYVVDIHVLDEAGAEAIRAALAKHGQVFERGPGIVVTRAVTPEDELSGFYEVSIWGRFKVYASVMDSRRENAT